MKKIALILVFIFTISFLSCTKTEKADSAIQNVTVIDATGAPAKSGMTVLITGNRILKMKPHPGLKPGVSALWHNLAMGSYAGHECTF